MLDSILLLMALALGQPAPAPAPVPPAPASPLSISGPDQVLPYKLVRLSPVGVESGATVVWDVYPDENIDIDERTDSVLAFIGPPGTYKIKCRTVLGKNVQLARKTVTIGTPAPPDPLTDALQQAVQSETAGDRSRITDLAAVYRYGASSGVPVASTVKQLTDAMHSAVQAGIGGALPKVRRVIADEINRQVTASPATQLDDALKARYAALYNRIASLLEGLK